MNMRWGLGLLTWTLPQEAVDALQPRASTLGAAVGGAVTLPGPLHGPVSAGGGTGAPAGPLVPHAIHWGQEGKRRAQQSASWGLIQQTYLDTQLCCRTWSVSPGPHTLPLRTEGVCRFESAT